MASGSVVALFSVVSTSFAPPRVLTFRAEHGFVDSDNLENGECCVCALKAFEDDGGEPARFLGAGALIRRRSDMLQGDVHDLWIADGLDPGAGPNLAFGGLQRIVDRLFRLHLRAAHNSGVVSFSILAGDGTGTTAAAHAAAVSRGFVCKCECEDSNELVLRFEPDEGRMRYEAAAAAAVAGNAERRTILGILYRLERSLVVSKLKQQ
mmetsp:Transcript_26076/g.43061  ORF Transcript_26076/g.43061 Transcript_26076/m.43061 type:complete len:208 (+) Transcript_26076:50-673(+)|eukprot:CAMPEP_0119342012 /NCGR_PEP_ID=MMETSP1333-20130426/103804_1 /TAXON_ID=418940 /ORGANISM="Scyphosphaera apsteinii, Strain RCC1455" /LENGTH=207 /DNA_ID=CAMNT_0007354133 /DNA_START=33 /DNA_END=656 /DNA_ORIENTATION=-